MTSTNRPLVGRGPHLDRITRALRGRNARGLVIAGAPGAGRTRLTAEVHPAWRISATRCASARPFAAFGGRSADEVRAALRGRAEPSVLVVDDAHLLDEASAALVHQLALHREVRLVATVMDGAPVPDAITALWKDELLGRLPLDPLTEPELAELLAAGLGGQIERRTVHRLAAMVHGDLRMLAEIVRAGALICRAGVWTWQGLPAIDGRIRELLAIRFGDLDEPAWDALTYAAFAAEDLSAAPGLFDSRPQAPADLLEATAPWKTAAAADPEHVCPAESAMGVVPADRAPRAGLESASPGWPLPPERLASVAGESAVEVLEARGILQADGMVRYAEIIRAMTGRLRARRVRLRLANLSDDPLRSALWRLECGDPVDAGELVAAARGALARAEMPLALSLGRTARSAGGGVAAREVIAEAAGLRARLDAETARLDEALAAADLSVTPEFGADTCWDEAAGAYCGHQARLARLRGRPRTALAWARDGTLRHPSALCLGELAHAAALLGDLSTALAAVPDGLARVWVLAAGGDHDGAVAAAQGVRGVFGLHDVVRLGRPESVLAELKRMHGAFAALAARQAAALIARDGSALEAVAREFERLGYLLYAAEAYAQAATGHARIGEQRRARAAVNHGWRLSRICEGARTPALTALAAPDLTLRQREIAQLAVAGLSNREIADRLTVSIRTVANHLCAVYDRLGVHDRIGLAGLFSGLETE